MKSSGSVLPTMPSLSSFAPGYMSDSELIVEMRFAGINLFITAVVPSEINDQLEKCMNGYVEANGVEQLDSYIKDSAASIPLPQQRGNIIKTIAVAGVCHRIGTTTYAIQFTKLLNLLGKKACYIQMNQTQYVEQILRPGLILNKINVLGKSPLRVWIIFTIWKNLARFCTKTMNITF